MTTLLIMGHNISCIVGENIKRLWKRAGYKSQRELARHIGKDPSELSKKVKGKSFLSEGLLEVLCKALNAEPWEFFIEKDVPIVSDTYEKILLSILRAHPEIRLKVVEIAQVLSGGEHERKEDHVQQCHTAKDEKKKEQRSA